MRLSLINKNNQVLDLLDKRRFVLAGAEGLKGIETDISEVETPYVDGSVVDNVKALPRGIELRFKLKGNIQESINYFPSYVKSKQWVTLKEESDDKVIIIKGIATIPPYTQMSRSCEIVLSIYCPQPYWEDLDEIVGIISDEIGLLYFPLETGQYFAVEGRPFGVIDLSLEKKFVNDGDTSVGMLIKLTALGRVVSPKISCSTGEQNGWYMQLNVVLEQNDEVEINTTRGNKYISINGSQYYNGSPILNALTFGGNDWLQLEQGENSFNITAQEGEGDVYFNIIYKRRYE